MKPSRNAPPHFKRIDLTDDATMARLLRNGAVWTLPRQIGWQDAINAIKRGLVPLDECPGIPEQARAILAA